MTPLFALFGADGAIGLVLNLLILFLVVVYLALIYWTYLDAKRRIEDPVLIACATAASVFPFVGTVVYTILRPPEYIEDREERVLELRSAELRLRQLVESSCPHCEYPIERNYLRCPNCERRLRNPCRKCRKPLDPKWGTCPYCETEVRRQRESGRDERDRSRGSRAAERVTRAGTSSGRSASRSDGDRDRPSRSDRPTRDRDRERERTQRPFEPSSGSSRSSSSDRPSRPDRPARPSR